ncbi:hydroxymethylglutaryl-CoA lyase [Solibacillus sp. FSL W8-0474]|uniref:hydroxymethylglutaryl-CoA lyase n=1 Tax=Solibacillus sp. FSL W8-0474 TaxID=2975336 RepID=UPI0030FCA774
MTQIILNECWARDGLQNQPNFIETEDKLKMLQKIADAGFKRIEATSFSHPKYVPQFKDSEELLSKLSHIPGVEFKTTCVNRKALDRAIHAKNLGYPVDEISFVMAASNEYNKINVNMENEKLLKAITENILVAQQEQFNSILVSISTAFGCKFQGEVKKEEVLKLVNNFAETGIQKFAISDTMGVANPKQSKELFQILKQNFPELTFIAHFHDTKGWGIANSFAALEVGITHFDVSLGGIGGPPAERIVDRTQATGNICTEDFVFMLHDMGFKTGIDEAKLMEIGRLSEHLLGRQRSYLLERI